MALCWLTIQGWMRCDIEKYLLVYLSFFGWVCDFLVVLGWCFPSNPKKNKQKKEQGSAVPSDGIFLCVTNRNRTQTAPQRGKEGVMESRSGRYIYAGKRSEAKKQCGAWLSWYLPKTVLPNRAWDRSQGVGKDWFCERAGVGVVFEDTHTHQKKTTNR